MYKLLSTTLVFLLSYREVRKLLLLLVEASCKDFPHEGQAHGWVNSWIALALSHMQVVYRDSLY